MHRVEHRVARPPGVQPAGATMVVRPATVPNVGSTGLRATLGAHLVRHGPVRTIEVSRVNARPVAMTAMTSRPVIARTHHDVRDQTVPGATAPQLAQLARTPVTTATRELLATIAPVTAPTSRVALATTEHHARAPRRARADHDPIDVTTATAAIADPVWRRAAHDPTLATALAARRADGPTGVRVN